MVRICVLGLGYIGLPTAAMLATHGLDVVGVDVNQRIVEALSNGEIHLQEPGLNSLVQSAMRSGHLCVSGSPEPADTFIIAVPTPVLDDDDEHGSVLVPRPDLSSVVAAAEAVGPCLRRGNLVILESTSPPGTTVDVVRPILEQYGLRAGRDFALAFAAERVIPGRILIEIVGNDRIVGGIDHRSAQMARDIYSSFVTGTIYLTDATTAEMVKLMENTFRDVNIALANEFSRVATAIGIDVNEAIDLANHHPRVTILRPGPGVGGHCIAVDPWFIAHAAPTLTPLIRTARAVNNCQPLIVADLVQSAVADLDQPTIAVLGLAYKADVDDLRESPSSEVVRLLQERGCAVRVHDACARALPDGTPGGQDTDDTLRDADVMVILTDHTPYRQLKPWGHGPSSMAHKRLVDTRRCLDYALWRMHGFTVHALGDGRAATTRAMTQAPDAAGDSVGPDSGAPVDFRVILGGASATRPTHLSAQDFAAAGGRGPGDAPSASLG